MPAFNINRIRSPLKDVYKTQNKWFDTNWQETLKKHSKELNTLIEKVDLFDLWSNTLQDTPVAKILIPEIFMDAFISIHFACMGLYKYANACLRSELESSLRMAFFSTHQIEFELWCELNKYYSKDTDLWGDDFKYFRQLKIIKEFNKNIQPKNLIDKIKYVYKLLSQYVHSGKTAFQTSIKFLPKYNIQEFKKWLTNYKDIQQLVTLILALGFAEKFDKKMRFVDKKTILKTGIYDKDYKKRLKELFKLRIRSRI